MLSRVVRMPTLRFAPLAALTLLLSLPRLVWPMQSLVMMLLVLMLAVKMVLLALSPMPVLISRSAGMPAPQSQAPSQLSKLNASCSLQRHTRSSSDGTLVVRRVGSEVIADRTVTRMNGRAGGHAGFYRSGHDA